MPYQLPPPPVPHNKVAKIMKNAKKDGFFVPPVRRVKRTATAERALAAASAAAAAASPGALLP